jgi:hypothetical protein
LPTLIQTIAANPGIKAFRRVGRGGMDIHNWQFEPIPGDVVAEADRDEFCVIAAMNIISKTDVRQCYMDVSLPERITDCVYFIVGNEIHYSSSRKFGGETIPASAIDGFGVYELFYSKVAPALGIEILRRGLAASKRKHFIAEDLGYIFRDEGRYQKAAEMFQLAVDEGASSYFIYGELAEIYGKIGNVEKQKKYAQLFEERRWMGNPLPSPPPEYRGRGKY